jgi:hypothetical protein
MGILSDVVIQKANRCPYLFSASSRMFSVALRGGNQENTLQSKYLLRKQLLKA